MHGAHSAMRKAAAKAARGKECQFRAERKSTPAVWLPPTERSSGGAARGRPASSLRGRTRKTALPSGSAAAAWRQKSKREEAQLRG